MHSTTPGQVLFNKDTNMFCVLQTVTPFPQFKFSPSLQHTKSRPSVFFAALNRTQTLLPSVLITFASTALDPVFGDQIALASWVRNRAMRAGDLSTRITLIPRKQTSDPQ